MIAGCASSNDPGVEGFDAADADAGAESDVDRMCRLDATVAVSVWNQGANAVRLTFGSYSPARITEGFSRETYHIPRTHLRGPVLIRVARGGLQVGGPARVLTEPVMCNQATLIIVSQPQYSVFYGDVIYSPSDLIAAGKAKAAADSAKAAADSAAAAADSIR